MLHQLFALFFHKPSRQIAAARRSAKPRVELLELRDLPACLVAANTCFGVIGDYGNAGQEEQDVADLVKGWNPDFIITVGDNNYEDGAASTIDANVGQYYHSYIFPYTGTFGAGASTQKFWPTLGNHDWLTVGAQPYLDYFTLPDNERYYNFKRGPVEFFAMDSDDAEPDGNGSTSIQANWLKSQLAKSTATWKIVYFHESPYSSGADHGSRPESQWPFQTWGATAVMTGHDHTYERVVLNGFPYFVDGLGGENRDLFATPVPGSQVRYNSDWGAMQVDASSSKITFQFITRTGQVIDTYTITSSVLPTVTISATDSSASEPGTNTGKFTVSRTGPTSSALTVNYTVGGTATAGNDYTALTGSVKISAGSSSATITVTAKDDIQDEPSETVTATLSSNSAYTRGTPNSSTVYIADNDPTISTILPFGTGWRYLDNGSNQGTGWRGLSFVDSAWKWSKAELGYGDGDEDTVVSYGADPNNKHITTYFRRSFSIADASLYSSLTVRLIRDDGAVVYLNGSPVIVSNMPGGTITYTTLASSAVGGSAESTVYEKTFGPGLLRNGNNVIAVEVHQWDRTSPDLSFDLELIASS
jgi:hypothetical protein